MQVLGRSISLVKELDGIDKSLRHKYLELYELTNTCKAGRRGELGFLLCTFTNIVVNPRLFQFTHYI